jgi:peptidyl-lysine (3S)-dioxygenase / protease
VDRRPSESDECSLWCVLAPTSSSFLDKDISDPYENIYTVVRGAKHFILFPPTEGWLLKGEYYVMYSDYAPALPSALVYTNTFSSRILEKSYPHAQYTRPSPSSPLELSPTSNPPVSWASEDPMRHIEHTQPLEVTVSAGETLYLPVGWWHHVRQSGDGEGGKGVCIAINYWYDPSFQGMSWPVLSFLRKVARGEVHVTEQPL